MAPPSSSSSSSVLIAARDDGQPIAYQEPLVGVIISVILAMGSVTILSSFISQSLSLLCPAR